MTKIPEKMKALLAYAPKDYILENINTPTINEHEILVKVQACLINDVDIKTYNGAVDYWQEDIYAKAPFIPGNEFVGTVVEKGENVANDLKINQNVVVEPMVACGKCYYCRRGKYTYCIQPNYYGYSPEYNGALAEYIKIKKNSLIHKVPEEIPVNEAVLIHQFAKARQAVLKTKIKNDDIVVIAGINTQTMGMVSAVMQANPKLLVVIDSNRQKLEKAKEFGASIIINSAYTDVKSEIMSITKEKGCEIYIDAGGSINPINDPIEILAKGGKLILLVAYDHAHVNKNTWNNLLKKEIKVITSHYAEFCYEDTIEWFRQKRFLYKNIVNSDFDLENWQEAFLQAISLGSKIFAFAIKT